MTADRRLSEHSHSLTLFIRKHSSLKVQIPMDMTQMTGIFFSGLYGNTAVICLEF